MITIRDEIAEIANEIEDIADKVGYLYQRKLFYARVDRLREIVKVMPITFETAPRPALTTEPDEWEESLFATEPHPDDRPY